MTRWPVSMRRRLTLWYSTALTLVLVTFSAASLYLFDSMLAARTDGLLRQASEFFANELATEYRELGNAPAAFEATLREVAFSDIAVAVFDARGRVVSRTVNAKWPRGSLDRPPREPSFVIPDSEGGVRGVKRTATLGAEAFTLMFLQTRHVEREATEELTLAFLVAIPLFLLVAGFGGHMLAHRALSPVADMSRRAREIGASNLHERLPNPEPHDEVGSLAAVINDLLARLERSFDLQRRFIADASHELRTAVAVVRAESEIALNRARSSDEYRESLRITHDAGKRLTLIVDDLLLLARADEGSPVMRPQLLHLDELVPDVVRTMRGLASERSIRIEVGDLPEAQVEGDEELLRRLLLNLLDNAVKYGPPESVVRLTLSAAENGWEIRVRDEGPGIPEESRELIFERFYRVERARSRTGRSETSGSGLGLSIARWVAEAHGGSLVLGRVTGHGSEFVATIPAAGRVA